MTKALGSSHFILGDARRGHPPRAPDIRHRRLTPRPDKDAPRGCPRRTPRAEAPRRCPTRMSDEDPPRGPLTGTPHADAPRESLAASRQVPEARSARCARPDPRGCCRPLGGSRGARLAEPGVRAGSPAHCRLIDCLTRLLAGQAGPTRAPGGPRALVPTATRATRSPRALSALPPPAPARPSLADVTLPPRLCPVGSLERGRTR